MRTDAPREKVLRVLPLIVVEILSQKDRFRAQLGGSRSHSGVEPKELL